MPRTSLAAFAMLAWLIAPVVAAVAETEAEERMEPATLFEIEARRLGGGSESLERYRGQVLVIVNTASRCGHTPQLEALQALYDRYRERGFSVLGFPSNDFAGQELGSDAEIGAFCRSNYGVESPMFSKVHVNRADAQPIYAYLTSLAEPVGGPVQWNFQKYLIDRHGVVVARYASKVRPQAPTLVGEIERLLAEPRPESPRARLVR